MEGKQLSDESNDSPIEPDRQFKSLYKSSDFWLIISLIVMVLSLIWFFYATSGHKKTGPKPISVVSAQAKRRDVPIYLAALGNVTPIFTVTVRTQINGLLLQVLFKEGQLVKTGDLLAQIDPRPYEAQLIQYEGNLKRDSALLANARIDLNRYQKLWKQNSISQQTLATQISLVEQYEGAVKIDQGLIQSTKVNLIYCRISSPIDGRIGLRLVDQGNFVQVTDTGGIAVINTTEPITVIFAVPEDNIQEIIPQVYANKTVVVQAYDRQQNQLLATGKILTIDNQIDPTTGTVKLRAVFDNKDRKLFPNQFVNIKMLVQTLNQVTLVPTAAIQHSVANDFVYLLNADKTVTVHTVETGPVSGSDTVVTKGLMVGQSVIVEGADKLVNGSVVSEKKNNANLPQKTVLYHPYPHNPRRVT